MRTVKLAPDHLENRELPAVATAVVTGTILTLYADDAGAAVVVESVAGGVRVREMGTHTTWTRALITEVRFVGGAGHDRFINTVATLPTKAWGKGGSDYFQGSGAEDIFFGGIGHDTLMGDGGNDALFGDAGHDTLLGNDGDDHLLGGDGNDLLNGGAGADQLAGGNGDDVLIAIDDGTTDFVQGNVGRNAYWLDANPAARDGLARPGSHDQVQWVTRFANGADRTLDGDSVADPELGPGLVYKRFTGPLFAPTGPSHTDPRQGDVGDCWLLAALGAIAMDSPITLRHNVVDFGDGTYGVRLGKNFYRVDADLPAASPNSTDTAYAALGADRSLWVAIVEKAYAHYRTANGITNSYTALNGGWSIEVNRAFGAVAARDQSIGGYPSAAALAAAMYNAWSSYKAVTIGFTTTAPNAPLINAHMYQVLSFVKNPAGQITAVKLRNPWGRDGLDTDSNPHDGLVTVSINALYACRGRVNWGRV